MRPNHAKRVGVAVAVSFVLSLLVSYVDHRRHPFSDLSGGDKTDHIAHMHMARLFPRLGFAVYRVPLERLLTSLDDEARRQLPVDERVAASDHGRDVYEVPGARPAYVSWSALPRPYPPGDMLAFAPVAALYEWTPLPFALANWMLVVSCLIYAHVGLFLLWQAIHDDWDASPLVRWGICLLVAVPILRFALDGFYDVVMIPPLFLSARWLHEGKWSRAAMAFYFAFFLHYRALFFAPYAILALVHACRSPNDWGSRDVFSLLMTCLLGGIASYTLFLVQPWLHAFPLTNPVNLAGRHFGASIGYVAFALFIVLAFWRVDARLDAAISVTLFALLISVRQVQAWHIIALIPWIAAPTSRGARSPWPARIIRGAATAFVYLVLVS